MHINDIFYLLSSTIKHFEIPDSTQSLRGDKPISLDLLVEWETEETKKLSNILKATQESPSATYAVRLAGGYGLDWVALSWASCRYIHSYSRLLQQVLTAALAMCIALYGALSREEGEYNYKVQELHGRAYSIQGNLKERLE